jgi:hypothetical protein
MTKRSCAVTLVALTLGGAACSSGGGKHTSATTAIAASTSIRADATTAAPPSTPSTDQSTHSTCGEGDAFPLEAFVTKPYFEWLRIEAGASVHALGTGHEPYPDATLVDLDATFVRGAATLRGEALPKLDQIFFDARPLAQFKAAQGKTRYVAASVSPPTSPPARAYANFVLVAAPDGTVSSPNACLQRLYGTRFAAVAQVTDGTSTTPEAAIVSAIVEPASEPDVVRALSGR